MCYKGLYAASLCVGRDLRIIMLGSTCRHKFHLWNHKADTPVISLWAVPKEVLSQLQHPKSTFPAWLSSSFPSWAAAGALLFSPGWDGEPDFWPELLQRVSPWDQDGSWSDNVRKQKLHCLGNQPTQAHTKPASSVGFAKLCLSFVWREEIDENLPPPYLVGQSSIPLTLSIIVES